MNNKTGSEIAQTLDVADEKAKYDAAAKKLIAQKSVVAYILKSTVEEFADIPVKEIAEKYIVGTPQVSEVAVHQDEPDAAAIKTGNQNDNNQSEEMPSDIDQSEKMLSGSDRIEEMPTEDVSIREGTVRFDVRFLARVPGTDDLLEIIINIEIQNSDMPGYPIPKRGIYYGSRMISAQRGTVFKDQEYGKIKKVVSIWICEDTALERSDVINEYRLTEHCRRGAYHEPEENYDLMRVIVMRLGAKGEQSDNDAIRLLSRLFSTNRTVEDKKAVLSDEFHIKLTEEINQEVSQVCNLSTGIYDRGVSQGRQEGMQEGMQKGIQQGMQKGIQQGMQKGTLKVLFDLVRDNILNIAEAAKRANIEPSEFEKGYKAYLG